MALLSPAGMLLPSLSAGANVAVTCSLRPGLPQRTPVPPSLPRCGGRRLAVVCSQDPNRIRARSTPATAPQAPQATVAVPLQQPSPPTAAGRPPMSWTFVSAMLVIAVGALQLSRQLLRSRESPLPEHMQPPPLEEQHPHPAAPTAAAAAAASLAPAAPEAPEAQPPASGAAQQAAAGPADDEIASMSLEDLRKSVMAVRLVVQQLDMQLMELQSEVAQRLPPEVRLTAEGLLAKVEALESQLSTMWKGAEEVPQLERQAAELQWDLCRAIQPHASLEQYRQYRSLLANLCLQRELLVALEARQEVLELSQQIKGQQAEAAADVEAAAAAAAAAAQSRQEAEARARAEKVAAAKARVEAAAAERRRQQLERSFQAPAVQPPAAPPAEEPPAEKQQLPVEEGPAPAVEAAAAAPAVAQPEAAAAAEEVQQQWEAAVQQWEGMVADVQQQAAPQAPTEAPPTNGAAAAAFVAAPLEQLPLAPPADAIPAPAVTTIPQLRLVAGGVSIPHPSKAETGGEDVFFVSSERLGAAAVADGVGGWALEGIDPALYPRELLAECEDALAHHEDPLALLMHAHERAHAPGSCTVCVAAMQPEGRLAVVSLGDCGVAVVREGEGVVFQAEVQEHQFNMPYQMASPQFLPGSSHPMEAHQYELEVQPGDVVVMGSDGLFDNLWKEDITAMVHRRLKDMRGASEPSALQSMCNQLAKDLAARAFTHSQDPTYCSPFAVERHEQLVNPFVRNLTKPAGGKSDDITVVVGVCCF